MQDQKSYAEFVLGTYRALLVDCARQYPELTKEFDRDFSRLSSALNMHGLRFFLDTMPAYRKHFDKCLDTRRLTPSHLYHFGVDKKGGTIPRLFRGLVLRVFERSGALRHIPDVEAVRLIRQLLGAVRKLRMDSNTRDTCKSIREFFRDDQEVNDGSLDWRSHHSFVPSEAVGLSFRDGYSASWDETRLQLSLVPAPSIPLGLLDTIQRVADLISCSMGSFDPYAWKPRHGPGAVSDQRYGSYKYDFKSWPDRLDFVFPWADFAFANYSWVPIVDHTSSHGKQLSRELPSKLCAVPKTLSKPRLIASEPTSHQWCQQIIKDYMYERVKRTWISNFITFDDQRPNGRLALLASQGSSHATIDLSSASDRISCWHVERLFRRLPCLLAALQSSRTVWITQAICRDSPRYHYLRKYSTMGNATTFPVQSLFFLAIALGTVLHQRGLRINFRNVRALGKDTVRVFGDDIIVPGDCSRALVDTLSALGLRVNSAKSFTEGNFRESCGVDAFLGHDVTSVAILMVPSTASPGSIVSSVDVNHNLADAGLLSTASYIRKTAEPIARYKVRTVMHRSGLFGWSHLTDGNSKPLKVRWNPRLQIAEVYAMRLRVSEHRRTPEDGSGLLQFFSEAPRVVTSVRSTLNYLTRRPRVGLSLGWVPVGNHHVA